MPDFKPVKFDKVSPNVIRDELSLIKLQQEIQRGAVETELKKLDFGIKQNQVLQLDVDNEKKRVDLEAAQLKLQKDRVEFTNSTLLNIRNAYQQSTGLGSNVLKQAIPGAQDSVNKDGTVSISIPGAEAFTINPGRVSDPVTKGKLEEQWRNRWTKLSQNFVTQHRNFKNLEKAIQLGTAQGDIGVLFAYMKIVDPGSVVRPGEIATAENAPNIPQRIRNMWNRQFETDGPILGGVDSISRKNFLDAATVAFNNAREPVVNQGKFLVKAVKEDGLRPQQVFFDVGDVNLAEISGGGNSAEALAAEEEFFGTGSSSKEASVIPTGGGKQKPKAQPKKKKNFDEILRDNLLPGLLGGPK